MQCSIPEAKPLPGMMSLLSRHVLRGVGLQKATSVAKTDSVNVTI